MNPFTGKRRAIAHPDCLKEAMQEFPRTTRLYLDGILPGSIEFPMIVVPIHRLLRSCFRNRWSMLWYLLVNAIDHEAERLYGVFYRFWRYRVQCKSQDADLHRMMTQQCPACNQRHTFTPVGTDRVMGDAKCDGCGAVATFEDRFLVADDEDGDA